jgi:anion-transporting  ArsA/GET3 family ATPase
MSAASIEGRRFIIVTGKGGVGKTTVCATLALHLAGQGKRVLVAMCNAKERLSAMLGSDLIGTEVKPVSKNVWAVNMTPDSALEEYGMLALKSKTLFQLLFDNKYVRVFFRAVPGIQEWAMLGKAWWHTTETDAAGKNVYDVVLLDAPATGHGLDMLRVPKVIVDVVPPGLLRRDAERAWNSFKDPKESGVVLVTLPEEMPAQETIELADALTKELGLPIAKIVVNGVLPPLFSKEERATLEALPDGDPGDDAGSAALLAGRARATRERVQAESLARLAKELPIAPSYFPLLFEDAAHPRAIQELTKRL